MRAVIFDMDGLLIDSEPLWVRAEIECFGEVGVVLTEEDCAETKGLRMDDVMSYRFERSPWSGPSPAEVEARIVARVGALVTSEGRALPGIAHAISLARAGGRLLGLASSSPEVLVGTALERLGLSDAFDVVQSAEHLPLGKPHPEVFLRTAARLGVPAHACLVFEDSINGVIAAKAARMACIAVPFDHPSHDPRFVLADAVVASLLDVTSSLIDSIARR